ncbi:MAG: class I SAM-dependent methyltransferase [Clostridia bacterium]|nr:class I SAM-dependent methyltransferase [Clostridia bacterium]
MSQKDFFNTMAEKWDSICLHDAGKINEILDLVKIKESCKVLDVGTGTGILIPFLHDRVGNAGEITAIDVADKMIAVAKSKYQFPNVKYIEGDVLIADIPTEYYDCIVCYSVFPHFSDKQAAIHKLSTYLKDGGTIAICHSQSREAISNLHRKASDVVASDDLPHIEIIKGYFEKVKLKTIVEVDTDRMFVVAAQK